MAAVSALLQRLASRYARWRDDPLRRASNEVGAALDGRIWWNTLAGGLLYLIFKHVIEAGLYGFAALVCCVHVLPIAAVEFWVRRQHPAAYQRHRELVVTLGISSTLYWAPVMVLRLHNHFAPHHGSALWLAVFILNTGTLWLGVFAAHACLPLRWGRVALPFMALLPLRHHTALCTQVVKAPGVSQPLGTLCDVLSLAHGVAVPTGGPDCSNFTPLQQCRTFYLWSLAWGGVALPLLATVRFEAQLRRRLEQAQQAQQAQRSGVLQTTLLAYLHSMAAWVAACSVEALLRPALGWNDVAQS
ncbi:voltage-dependent R-type calcium channel subunit alpha-1E-like isoform X5 [Chlorella sorokiniana]|uniref:Voltage-dependent R-type calcium channel subunit alpha-1E-like isoform X5 n=1 Tax=Chlorella sorokiniana TaxID=3076 RepID=A0A2P6TJ62_CHLSO|nr:voltage-dependent R-type calcium channel subunit alpha-1E-like isoform X5 [Chlorella sorokiniana]|eukprot:PRW39280.1 voltage-dependent R-type calcium channel subunit alpha-1E-like isoform X5 [Chlorella sorokiniana]